MTEDRGDTDLIPNAEASFECAVPPVFEEATLKSSTPHIPSIWVSPALLQSATQNSHQCSRFSHTNCVNLMRSLGLKLWNNNNNTL